jgi:hypothetical protein
MGVTVDHATLDRGQVNEEGLVFSTHSLHETISGVATVRVRAGHLFVEPQLTLALDHHPEFVWIGMLGWEMF